MIATLDLVDEFRRFAKDQLREDGAELTIDELYVRWRSEQERQETIRAIQVGIEQIDRGEGLTIEEAEVQIREHLGLAIHKP